MEHAAEPHQPQNVISVCVADPNPLEHGVPESQAAGEQGLHAQVALSPLPEALPVVYHEVYLHPRGIRFKDASENTLSSQSIGARL